MSWYRERQTYLRAPDTLLDLHAKLQTAVRYYDRMLEDRLSKTFSQHSIGGYNLPAPRQPSGPYPTLHSNAPTSMNGPAENYYTGEAQSDYGRPVSHAVYPHPSQATPQPQYATYDNRASMPPQHQYPQQQQQPPRHDSWNASALPHATQYAPQQNYPPSEAATPQMSHVPTPHQPQQGNPAEPIGTTPTSDPNASFYFQQPGQNPQASPSAPSEVAPSPYPNLQQSAPQYSQQPGAETPGMPPQSAPQQAQQQQPSAPPAQSQPSAPYWQHPAAQHVQVPVPSGAPWQQAPPQQHQQAYPSYQQDAFPLAPQHAPAKPAVEEALIEL